MGRQSGRDFRAGLRRAPSEDGPAALPRKQRVWPQSMRLADDQKATKRAQTTCFLRGRRKTWERRRCSRSGGFAIAGHVFLEVFDGFGVKFLFRAEVCEDLVAFGSRRVFSQHGLE